jgi:signal transduction histidine kinase
VIEPVEESRDAGVRDGDRILEASRLRCEFLANMSHELRGPLNAILGFADLMFTGKAGPVGDAHKEYLGEILESSRHLLRLINDVMAVARMETGRLMFRPEAMDLAQVVGEVEDILRGPASLKRVRLETILDPTLPTVSLDPAKFKLVLYGYLSNALKLAPEEGQVTLRVSVQAPDRFRIEVATASVDTHGPGAALAFNRQIVEAQGGQVEVRSGIGLGTVHSVVLPTSTSPFVLSE